MSKHELVEEYLNGRMDRRQFIQRLIAMGVSVVAAGTFAQTLASNAADARTNRRPEYPPGLVHNPGLVHKPLRP